MTHKTILFYTFPQHCFVRPYINMPSNWTIIEQYGRTKSSPVAPDRFRRRVRESDSHLLNPPPVVESLITEGAISDFHLDYLWEIMKGCHSATCFLSSSSSSSSLNYCEGLTHYRGAPPPILPLLSGPFPPLPPNPDLR